MSCRCRTAACRRRSAMPSNRASRSSSASSARIMSAAPSSSPATRSAISASSSSTTPIRALIKGKSIVLVDDSIVRGTTSLKIVQMMREAGAREVHMRIASPPTRHSCFYGVDTPERAKLLAAQMDVADDEQIYRRRQPRLRLDRRPLPRSGRDGARRGARRSIATPASAATIRPISPTRRIWRNGTSSQLQDERVA